MNEYRDIPLYGAEDTKNFHTDTDDNAVPEAMYDAAETEILSAVSDITPEEDGTEPDAETFDPDDGQVPTRHRRNHRGRNIAIASVIAAVVVLAGGAGGYAYAASNVQKGVDAAQANAQAVDRQLTKKIAEARELLDGTEEGQVADADVLTALTNAIDKADAQSGVDTAGANRWLIWQELDAQATYDADAKDAEEAMNRLDKAMLSVTGSVDAKTLADAKQALQSTVDGADKTYTDSDGKVQDNATRDSLKTALDAAKKVLDDDGVSDAKEYTDQKTAVDNAVKTVNDSIAAKDQADAEAKAQAEAAAAAASSAAPASGGSYSGGSYSGSGYYGGGTSSGSYSGGGTSNGYTPSYNGGSSSTGGNGNTNSGAGSSNGGSYHGGDKDSMGNVWTELEGDSWSW